MSPDRYYSKSMTQAPLDNWHTFGLFDLPEYCDERGALGVVEATDRALFPFDVKRIFWIHNVPPGQTRGCHAHRSCAEVLVALKGSMLAHVTDGQHSATYLLDNPKRALYIPAKVWCSFTEFTPECLCLCLASHPYEHEGYINSLPDFMKAVKR